MEQTKTADINDISYIEQIKKAEVGKWHQYDVLLAARGYGWDMMIDWAEYMAKADLKDVSEVTVGSLGAEAKNITASYLEKGSSDPELEQERGILTIAGISKVLNIPIKIVWVNQTRTLRFFTLSDNLDDIKRYTETMARRTFGTENEMRLFPTEEQKEETNKYIKKKTTGGRVLLSISLISFILFQGSAIAISYIGNIMFLFMFLFFFVSIPCFIVYFVKFFWFGHTLKLLKKSGREHYLDDIFLSSSPTLEKSKIYCGHNAFFSKKTGSIVPYEDVAWIYSVEGSPKECTVRLKSGKKAYVIFDQAFEYSFLMNRFILPKVGSVIEGKTIQSKRDFVQRYPDASPIISKGKFIAGSIITAFALFCFSMGLINDTLDGVGMIVVGVFGAVGLSLLLYGIYEKKLTTLFANFNDTLINSDAVNKIFKFGTCLAFIGLPAFFVCGALENEPLLFTALGIYGVGMIFLILSLALGVGFFPKKGRILKQKEKPREIKKINRQINPEKLKPVFVNNNSEVCINYADFMLWLHSQHNGAIYEFRTAIPLTEKEPTLVINDNDARRREYLLQTEGEEDFSGKYFLLSVRLGVFGHPAAPAALIDGFVSDTPEDRAMTLSDIGYRMEAYFLVSSGELGQKRYNMLRGQDLPMKALKYQGYTTPSNVRLIGVCPDCDKSFCFHGYAFYMAQADVAYSDDGLSCCQIIEQNIDRENWSYEEDGKTFRYYNSFCCPHCGTPYIDYKKFPENKVFGVSGCVHLGTKHYTAE